MKQQLQNPRARRGRRSFSPMRPIHFIVERFTPNALVFAILLTFVVAIMANITTGMGPAGIISSWGEGLSGLLPFMSQMALILLLGHALAHTRPARRLLTRIGSMPRNPIQAYLLVFGVASIGCLLNWGVGLIGGALLAKEIAAQGKEKGLRLHYPLLIAAAFSGFVVWQMGYSASAPLLAATDDSFITEMIGSTIPVTETVLAPWNIAAAVVTIVVVSLALMLVAPRRGQEVIELAVDAREPQNEDSKNPVKTPADRLDASRIITTVLGLGLVTYLALHFFQGGTLTLDIVNWSLLALLFLMVRNTVELISLTKDAASSVGEILLQFPLYAGIMGIVTSSGMVILLAEALAGITTPATFGVVTFLSAGFVNFFVPSGGGQLAVQGPIIIEAAQQMQVDPAVAIMAFSYGDQWTNMIQPFWALPLLAIAGLKIRDILGYTTVTLVASGLVFIVTLLLVGAGSA